MENPKEQLVSRLKEANNVLVTVSANPSVDQLAAAIGLTLFLTKLKKHSTAVFSGEVPSTIEFLKPEETIEDNTDSLQDFIIALDKNKADKIRYKVEDQMVKIFITPYRTSIAQDDLVFSKGDFNVDVVVALGVQKKDDLDQAITAHGRILHDATVSTVNTQEGAELGSLNWTDQKSSSLCEMVVLLADQIKPNSFDAQMATAFLTGIVAETERFSNVKTTSNTMNASAKLMAAGANQQLVAEKLEETPPEVTPQSDAKQSGEDEDEGEGGKGATVVEDGSLVIHHEQKEPEKSEQKPDTKAADKSAEEKEPEKPAPEEKKPEEKPEPEPKAETKPEAPPEKKVPEPAPYEPPAPPITPPQVSIDKEGQLKSLKRPDHDIHIKPEHREFLATPPSSQQQEDNVIGGPAGQSLTSGSPPGSHFITEPPSMGGKLSAAADDFDQDESPLSLPPVEPPILSHDNDKSHDKPKDDDDKPPAMPPPPPPPPPEAPPPPPPPPPKEPSKSVTKKEEKKDFHEKKAPKSAEHPISTPPAKPAEQPPPEKVEKPEHKSKLPESFIKVLDDHTLKELERRTHSPHQTQPADQMKGKTLDTIEESVHSSHRTEPPSLLEKGPEKNPVLPGNKPSIEKKPKDSLLEYEAHESEPLPRGHHAVLPDRSLTKKDIKPTGPVEEAASSVFSKPPAPLRDLTTKPEDTPTEGAASVKPPESHDIKPSQGSSAPTADAARDAITKAINVGGDGRTALPRVESIGSTDVGLNLGHQQALAAPVHTNQQETSPHIHIDDEGNVTFKDEPIVDEAPRKTLKLPDDHASSDASSSTPPPGPPPMMPPHLAADQGV